MSVPDNLNYTGDEVLAAACEILKDEYISSPDFISANEFLVNNYATPLWKLCDVWELEGAIKCLTLNQKTRILECLRIRKNLLLRAPLVEQTQGWIHKSAIVKQEFKIPKSLQDKLPPNIDVWILETWVKNYPMTNCDGLKNYEVFMYAMLSSLIKFWVQSLAADKFNSRVINTYVQKHHKFFTANIVSSFKLIMRNSNMIERLDSIEGSHYSYSIKIVLLQALLDTHELLTANNLSQ